MDSVGSLTYATGTVAITSSTIMFGGTETTAQMNGNTAISIVLPAGQRLVPGVIDSNQAGVAIIVQENNAFSNQDVCDTTPGVGSATYAGAGFVRVDQVKYDGSGNVTALAIQYSCQTNGLVLPSISYFGEMADNVVPTTPHQGYYSYEANGNISGFGNDSLLTYFGNLAGTNLNQPIVGMAQTPDGGGYWMVASDGGVFAFGDAGFYGSMGGTHLNQPIVGMAATPDGKGYWFVARDGGIFSFGDAGFYGSMGGTHLNQPIVGMAPSPSRGYWLVAADGGIFAFGGAPFYGSTGNIKLNRPVVGMTATPDGGGYWFVASDGGIFAYGNAGFFGSMGGSPLNQPIVNLTRTADGLGYRMVADDGGIFAFGNAPFVGSLPGDGVSVTDVVGLST